MTPDYANGKNDDDDYDDDDDDYDDTSWCNKKEAVWKVDDDDYHDCHDDGNDDDYDVATKKRLCMESCPSYSKYTLTISIEKNQYLDLSHYLEV